MKFSGLVWLLSGLVVLVGCGGGDGGDSQYKEVDPSVDLANAVRMDIEQMKTAEGGPAGEALAFMENMQARVSEASEENKAVYEEIFAKAKELNEVAQSSGAEAKLEELVAEIEELASQLPGEGQ